MPFTDECDYTPNLHLRKPYPTSHFNLNDWNANSDDIDAAVTDDRERLDAIEALIDDPTNPLVKKEYVDTEIAADRERITDIEDKINDPDNPLVDKEYVDGQLDDDRARITTIEDKINDSENPLTDKTYVDTHIAAVIHPNSPDTQTGATSTNPLASKSYVDESATSIANDVSAIQEKIPTAASSTNQLADKSFVSQSIESIAAYPISYDAAGNSFPSKAALTSATTYYSGGEVRSPLTKNDYAYVVNDETHNNHLTRYTCVGLDASSHPIWQFLIEVNTENFSTDQWAAINSGATTDLISKLLTANIDTTPTSGSTKFVTSGGVYNAIIASSTSIKAANFTFVIDSDAALSAFATKATGNTYTRVLVRAGSYTYNGAISAPTNTACVVGEDGAILNCRSFNAGAKVANSYLANLTFNFSSATHAVGAATHAALINGWSKMLNCNVNLLSFASNSNNYSCLADFEEIVDCNISMQLSSSTQAAYTYHLLFYCNNLTNCVAKTVGGTTTTICGYSYCNNLTNCVFSVTSGPTTTSYQCQAFYYCNYLFYCQALGGYGSAVGKLYEFYYCGYVAYCRARMTLGAGGASTNKYVYTSSSAQNQYTNMPPSDTPLGGFNSSAV